MCDFVVPVIRSHVGGCGLYLGEMSGRTGRWRRVEERGKWEIQTEEGNAQDETGETGAVSFFSLLK